MDQRLAGGQGGSEAGDVGRRIVHARQLRALTQQELAKSAGLSRNLIAEAELGKRRPRPSSLRSIAVALGMQVEDLTGGSGGGPSDATDGGT